MRATLRRVHLVGSQPADVEQTTQNAMNTIFHRFGDVITTLPHGDIARQRGIAPIIHRTQALPEFRVIRPGLFRNYADFPLAEFSGSQLEFPRRFLGYYSEAFVAFQARVAIEAEYGVHDGISAIQIGVPFWLDHRDFSVHVTSQREQLTEAFVKVLADELIDIHQEWGDQVVVQLESSWSLRMVQQARIDRSDPTAVAEYVARAFALLHSRLPSSLRVGLHLCRGDINHESWEQGQVADLEPLVLLANAISRQWPSIEYVHLPIVASDAWRSSKDSSFYRPLSRLDSGTRWLAGVVHERATLDENCRALKLAAKALGRPFDGIALACGMGRMTHRQYVAALASLQETLVAMS